MHLYRIRQMAVAADMSVSALRYLIECRGECEHLDYKEELHLAHDYDRANLARDVLAMKNVGGGYIVVGVRNGTWEPVGIQDTITQDTKELRDVVRSVTGIELDIDIVRHSLYIHGSYRNFVLILTRGSAKISKRRTPSICKVSFHPRETWGLRDGDIYFRRGDQTVRVHSGEELESLLLSKQL